MGRQHKWAGILIVIWATTLNGPTTNTYLVSVSPPLVYLEQHTYLHLQLEACPRPFSPSTKLITLSLVKFPPWQATITRDRKMAKKSATDHVSHWKKQPAKHINKRRKLRPVLQKFFNYIKSDSYMFAPCINPRSSPPASSVGEVSFEPISKKEKKLVDVVKEYLKCNTYMYAPLVTDSSYDGTTPPSLGEPCRGNAETGTVCDQMETIMEETTADDGDDEHRLTNSRDIECVNGLNSVGRIVVEHSLLQSERVKHIVHQNSASLSATGKVLAQKKPRKVVVE